MAQTPRFPPSACRVLRPQVSFTMPGIDVNTRCLLCLFRIRQENDMVDSAPQWEAVLRRQKEKAQVDPNNRRSRHRSRSYVGSFSTFVPNPGVGRGRCWMLRLLSYGRHFHGDQPVYCLPFLHGHHSLTVSEGLEVGAQAERGHQIPYFSFHGVFQQMHTSNPITRAAFLLKPGYS